MVRGRMWGVVEGVGTLGRGEVMDQIDMRAVMVLCRLSGFNWVENSGLREVSSLLYHCSHLCASHILSFIHHSISLFVSLSVCSSVFLPSLLPPLCTRWHHRRR
jgi:hypothetical protein